MPIISVPSLGQPGDTITAAKLNAQLAVFDGVELDGDTNIMVDGVQTRHLIMTPSIFATKQVARNTSSALTTYTGDVSHTKQPITHGSAALAVAPGVLLAGQTIRFHWHQYVDNIDSGPTNPQDMTDRVTFYLMWDLGDGFGYVNIPNLPGAGVAAGWAVSGYNENLSGVIDQQRTHNMTGSWLYKNGASPINIVGVKLYVKPSAVNADGFVELGEGTLFTLILGPS